jgi:DNA polymerase I-like protein with 3'-5' exonuclease and polymerase domains
VKVTELNYGIVESLKELRQLVTKMMDEGQPIGLDCETGYDGPDKPGAQLHPEEGFVTGISFTNSLKWARYLPLRHDYHDNVDNVVAAEIMRPMFDSGLIVAHNAFFEERMISAWFREYIKSVANRGYFPVLSDTMIECARTGLWKSQGLKALVYEIFGHQMTEFLSLFPGAPKTKEKSLRFNILELTPEVVSYACEDALWCLALHHEVFPKVKDNSAYKLEMSILQEVMPDLHDDGIIFNWEGMREYLKKAQDFSNAQYSEIQKELSQMLGHQVTINLNSPQQVAKVLYEDLGFSTTRMTKSSQDSADPKMSTDAKALEGLAKEQPVVRKILEWKEVRKLIGSYLEKYERDFAYDKETGRAHPQYNQCWVISGRFSCSEPNIQQLPAGNFETPEGKKITRYTAGDQVFEMCFRDFVEVPEGWYGLGFDYSAAELRALAGESGEPELLDAFEKGIDVHKRTAALLYGITEDEVSKIQRKHGKTLNFQILYGSGIKSLGESLGISYEEAEDLYYRYMSVYSKIADYIQERSQFGKQHGYVVSKFGRKMRIWEYDDPRQWVRAKADRMAVNCTIQSSATGDYPKIAMVRAKRAIKAAGLDDKIRLIMNCHDALEFYVHNSLSKDEVIALLEPAVVFPVPGWPKMVADWHIWMKYGSPQELKRNEEGLWVVEDEKKAAPKIDYTDIVDDLIKQTTSTLHIELKSGSVPRPKWQSFISLLDSNPGEREVIIKMPQGELKLPKKTSLTMEDNYTITRLLGDCVLSYKVPTEIEEQ